MSATAVPIQPLARGAVAKLWLGLIALVLAAIGLAWLGTGDLQRETTASGLQYQVVEEGEGATITPADLAIVHLVGRRPNGEMFANTLGGEPVPIAVGNFVPGFDEALQLMRQGSRYRIWVPSSLAYGDDVPEGAPFEAGETLFFDIRILQVAPGMAAMQQLMRGPGGPEGPMPQGSEADEGAAPPAEAPPQRRGRR